MFGIIITHRLWWFPWFSMFGWQWAFYGQSLWADIGWDRIIPTGCASLCRMYPACHKLSISARLSSILYGLIVISVYHWLRNVMSMTDYVQIWWSFQVGSKTVIWRKKQSSWPLASIWARPLCPFDVLCWWVAPGHHHKARQWWIMV
jgi:hypothetical protein